MLLLAIEERVVPTVSLFDGNSNFVGNYSGANAVQQAITANIQNAQIVVYNDATYSDFVASGSGQSIIGRDVSKSYATLPFQGDGNVSALGAAVTQQPAIFASGTGTTVTLSGNGNTINNLNVTDQSSSDPVGVLVSGNNNTITNSTIQLHAQGVVINAGVNGLTIDHSSITGNTQDGILFNGGPATQNVSVNNDFITGNVTSGTPTFAGVRFTTTYSGSNVGFFYDDLSGNGGAGGVLNQSTVPNASAYVNFSFDWWGAAGGPSGATLNGIAAPGNGTKVTGPVDVSPFLVVGDADATPSNGFQPSVLTLDVTRYQVQTGSLSRIQEAIGDPGQPGAVPGLTSAGGVAAGGTVNVAAGTYAENIVVNKSVSLLGPNAGIDGNSGSRVAEATIDGGSRRRH